MRDLLHEPFSTVHFIFLQNSYSKVTHKISVNVKRNSDFYTTQNKPQQVLLQNRLIPGSNGDMLSQYVRDIAINLFLFFVFTYCWAALFV